VGGGGGGSIGFWPNSFDIIFIPQFFRTYHPPPCVQLCLENYYGSEIRIYIFFFFSFEVARHICDDSYGLVFGFNTFLALLFQSILTLIVADDAGLALDPRTQVRTSRFKKLVCLSVRLSVHLSVCPSVFPCICTSVRLSVYLSVYSSVCLSNLTWCLDSKLSHSS
jgi:hypothetical protein